MSDLMDLPLRKRFVPYMIGVKYAGGYAILDLAYFEDGGGKTEFSEVVVVESEGVEAAFYLARPDLRPVIDAARRVKFA